MEIFESRESVVRSYCRSWPTVFARARGAELVDDSGRVFLDFCAGAGALNYGHNEPQIKRALLDFLAADGVVQGLDTHTVEKRIFLEALERHVLVPRGLPHRVQFTSPSGASAVEAALQVARKATGRRRVVAFEGSFHGMTLGALSVTGSARRSAAGVPLGPVTFVEHDGVHLDGPVRLDAVERALDPAGHHGEPAAAVVLETVQGEAGLRVARDPWLRGVAALARAAGALLIVDDVQMGCGRTGPFLSTEPAGVVPDVVCLSKSLSGYGLPLAVVLIAPEYDVWAPGEHNGTFRGSGPAFVTAAAAIATYWADDRLERATVAKGELVAEALDLLVGELPGVAVESRGRGLARGLRLGSGALAAHARRAAFERGLLVETAGVEGEVLKVTPPLTVPLPDLRIGLAALAEAVRFAAERATAPGRNGQVGEGRPTPAVPVS